MPPRLVLAEAAVRAGYTDGADVVTKPATLVCAKVGMR